MAELTGHKIVPEMSSEDWYPPPYLPFFFFWGGGGEL